MYLMKIQINFKCKKIFRFIFNENTDIFLYVEKFLDLYLMKIQISFYLEKFLDL